MRRRALVMAVLLVALVGATILALTQGAAALSSADALRAVLSRLPGLAALDPGLSAAQRASVFDLRLPRLALALLVGCAGAGGRGHAGVLSKLDGRPSIIGVPGASLGATVAVVGGLTGGSRVWGRFRRRPSWAPSLTTAAVYVLSRRGGPDARGSAVADGHCPGQRSRRWGRWCW